ncbi:unnamed protein product [Camellia sinensis]
MRISRSLKVWKMGTVNYLEALKLQDKLVSDKKTLGTINYLEALKLQDKLVSDRKTHKISDTILSLQHPPTYTLGKQRTDHNLLVPEPDLKNIGAELHYTQRGEDITFHGPHQAILYPIRSLWDIGLGARKYVGDRKIGAIGVRISSGITSHGLAFNIDPNLSYFKHIVPCGIADKDVTSLRRETDKVLPAEDVIHEQSPNQKRTGSDHKTNISGSVDGWKCESNPLFGNPRCVNHSDDPPMFLPEKLKKRNSFSVLNLKKEKRIRKQESINIIMGSATFLEILLAIVLPPVGVFFRYGIG